MKTNRPLLIPLFIQLAVLIGAFFWYQAGHHYPRVILKAVPVDPRDFLRGHYVILGYEISRIPDSLKDYFSEDAPVFITLKKQPDGIAQPIDYLPFRPSSHDAIYIQGIYRHDRIHFPDIEKYYVHEKRGDPPQPWTVEIALHPKGRPQIIQLYANGIPWR
jgi:uncharacterized membrane-anchored protein